MITTDIWSRFVECCWLRRTTEQITGLDGKASLKCGLGRSQLWLQAAAALAQLVKYPGLRSLKRDATELT